MKKRSDKQRLRAFFDNAAASCRDASPVCRHFGDCGGCEFQDIDYDRQLRLKRDAFDFIAGEVAGEFAAGAEKLAGSEDADPDEAARLRHASANLEAALRGVAIQVQASPAPFGYRQRMDYVFAFGSAGLRRTNRHRQVVELEECPLLGAAGFNVVRKARKLAEAAGLESYDYIRHHGELRYFVIRRSRNGQTLLSLVTKTADHGDAVRAVLDQLLRERDITSGYWLHAPGLGDVSFGKPQDNSGQLWIVETMNGIDLRIGPNTFFQSNPAVAEKAYAAIRDFCPPDGLVLDMYSGVASIALSVAPRAGRVLAAENQEENVALATVNIEENGVPNVVLVRADAAGYLKELADAPQAPRVDMVVVNPPRPGVGAEGMAAIARLAPPRLAYLSCNPYTLLRDIAPLLDEYSLRSLTLYDMFPQTRHFESLALLEKT